MPVPHTPETQSFQIIPEHFCGSRLDIYAKSCHMNVNGQIGIFVVPQPTTKFCGRMRRLVILLDVWGIVGISWDSNLDMGRLRL